MAVINPNVYEIDTPWGTLEALFYEYRDHYIFQCEALIREKDKAGVIGRFLITESKNQFLIIDAQSCPTARMYAITLGDAQFAVAEMALHKFGIGKE